MERTEADPMCPDCLTDLIRTPEDTYFCPDCKTDRTPPQKFGNHVGTHEIFSNCPEAFTDLFGELSDILLWAVETEASIELLQKPPKTRRQWRRYLRKVARQSLYTYWADIREDLQVNSTKYARVIKWVPKVLINLVVFFAINWFSREMATWLVNNLGFIPKT